MTRLKLVHQMAKNHKISFSQAEKRVDLILNQIEKALAQGRRVELRGFGVFEGRVRPSRQARNPRTKALVRVPEKKVPFFKAGALLKKRLNQETSL